MNIKSNILLASQIAQNYSLIYKIRTDLEHLYTTAYQGHRCLNHTVNYEQKQEKCKQVLYVFLIVALNNTVKLVNKLHACLHSYLHSIITLCRIIMPVPKWHFCTRLSCSFWKLHIILPRDRPLSRKYITDFVFSAFHLTGEIFIFN